MDLPSYSADIDHALVGTGTLTITNPLDQPANQMLIMILGTRYGEYSNLTVSGSKLSDTIIINDNGMPYNRTFKIPD